LKLYIPAIIWTLVILYLSAFPAPQIDIGFIAPDKLGHLLAYAVLSISMAWKNIKSQEKLSRNWFLIVLIISASYGILMEIMQYLFFPNRYFDYGDMVANLLGSFFGLLAVQIYCLNKK
jgi:VanZ family protein